MKPDVTRFPVVCDICGKRRSDRSVDHSRCSKIRQQRKQEEDAQPYKSKSGKVHQFPGGRAITVKEHREIVNKQVGKRYALRRNLDYWKKFD